MGSLRNLRGSDVALEGWLKLPVGNSWYYQMGVCVKVHWLLVTEVGSCQTRISGHEAIVSV